MNIADPTRNMTHRIHMQSCSKAYVPKPATATPPIMSAELVFEFSTLSWISINKYYIQPQRCQNRETTGHQKFHYDGIYRIAQIINWTSRRGKYSYQRTASILKSEHPRREGSSCNGSGQPSTQAGRTSNRTEPRR